MVLDRVKGWYDVYSVIFDDHSVCFGLVCQHVLSITGIGLCDYGHGIGMETEW